MRLICRRALFSAGLVPSTPTKEVRLSTAGSFRIILATCRWRSAMLAKETDCGAWRVPWIMPLSWIGKKPFGIKTHRIIDSARVLRATPSVSHGWFSTRLSQRP